MVGEAKPSISSKIRTILSDGKWKSVDEICEEYDEKEFKTRKRVRTAIVSMYGTGKLERKMVDGVGSVYRINEKGRNLGEYPSTSPNSLTKMSISHI